MKFQSTFFLSKFESPDIGEEADTGITIDSHPKLRNLKSTVFGDNFSVPFPEESTYTQRTFTPCDIIQSSLYLRKFNDVINIK